MQVFGHRAQGDTRDKAECRVHVMHEEVVCMCPVCGHVSLSFLPPHLSLSVYVYVRANLHGSLYASALPLGVAGCIRRIVCVCVCVCVSMYVPPRVPVRVPPLLPVSKHYQGEA